MSKNLKGKTAFIVAILVIFVYGIFGLPHGVSGTALKDALLERIHLGLDLKGGVHLVYKVHVEEAINTTSDRDVQRMQQDLATAGVTNATVHKQDPVAHPDTITVSGFPANKGSDVRGVLTGTTYSQYDVNTNADGSITMKMKQAAIRDIESQALQHSVETVTDRVNSLGVSEANVAPYGLGDNELLVELPGISDPAKVEDAIKSTSKLAIYPVVGNGGYPDEQSAMAALNGVLPPDQWLAHGQATPTSPEQVFVLQRASVVEGTDFRDARPSTDQNGRPNMNFTLTTEAGERFYKYTSAHSKDSSDPGSMAIVLGNRVKEVASILSGIHDSGEISGSFTKSEVEALALTLRTGALPASLDVIETRTVGASLGEASIRQGVTAAVAGMLAVMIFMLVYYRGAGINADLALLLNLIFLLGAMGFIGATLTLPGIAGVILTIGMGVDSNVLIFERIREELRAGKTAASAVQQGFAHAWITIVDTHVTTIVSAAILFLFGTGPVKGFAVTLTIGLLANLFTAVFVSRVIFDALLARKQREAALSI